MPEIVLVGGHFRPKTVLLGEGIMYKHIPGIHLECWMQATQNGSDLWLSYWVSHEHEQRLRLGGPADFSNLDLPDLAAGEFGLRFGQTSALQGATWTWAGAYIPFRCPHLCIL